MMKILLLIATLAASTLPVPRALKPVPAAPVRLTGEIVTANDIAGELSGLLDGTFFSTDGLFGCLPESEVRRLVAGVLKDFDTTYIAEARDCDDLGLEAIVDLRRAFRKATSNVPLAPAVGFIGVKLVSDIPEMGYLLGGRTPQHAAVIVRCAGGRYLLVDPGTKRVSEFTQYLYGGEVELGHVFF